MRFLGHCIGHKTTEAYIHESSPERAVTPDTEAGSEDEGINVHNTENIQRNDEGDGNEDGDIESEDAEEEADFGYETDPDKGGDSEQGDEEDDDDDDDDDEYYDEL
jgi:hypothetical protein